MFGLVGYSLDPAGLDKACCMCMLYAGMCMLQLAIPAMRTDRALRQFNTQYGTKYGYNLQEWRKGAYLTSRDCAVLDADNGIGEWA